MSQIQNLSNQMTSKCKAKYFWSNEVQVYKNTEMQAKLKIHSKARMEVLALVNS